MASRLASTKARLGFSIERRLGDAERRSALPLSWILAVDRAGRSVFAVLVPPPQPQLFFSSTAGLVTGLPVLASCERFRSLLVSAFLPPRARASRRASTRSLLGLAFRWSFTCDRAGADAVGIRVAVRRGETATGAAATPEDSASLALVRVALASEAVRTRFAPALTATEAFLPDVVSAFRRSSASSRLESLAMSAQECRREVKGDLSLRKNLSPDIDQGSERVGPLISGLRRPRSRHPGFGCRRRNRRCARGDRDKRDGKPQAHSPQR